MPTYIVRLSGRLEGLPPDLLFRYSTAIGTLAGDGFLFLVVLLIARGLPFREVFALRPTNRWGLAALAGVVTLIGAYALAYAEEAVIPIVREQSVPVYWDETRIGAWVANFITVAILAPLFEESVFRGLGFALLEPLGIRITIFLTATAFTLAHGVIVDIPVIFATGLGLGYIRAMTGSIYPSAAVHIAFNAFGIVVAALVGG